MLKLFSSGRRIAVASAVIAGIVAGIAVIIGIPAVALAPATRVAAAGATDPVSEASEKFFFGHDAVIVGVKMIEHAPDQEFGKS